MSAPRQRSVLARAGLLFALVIAQSVFLETSELAGDLTQSAQRLVALVAGAVLRALGLAPRIDGIRIELDAGAAVAVTPDCVGLDVSLLLATAMLVYPAPWQHKLAGCALAVASVTGANLVRVVTLSWLTLRSRELFELVHVYAWPCVLIAVCLGVFVLWIGRLPREAESDASAA